MSSKIGISIDEVLDAVAAIPPANWPENASDTLALAMTAMAAREKIAVETRVIIYRYDIGEDDEANATHAAIISGTRPMHDIARGLNCDLQLIELGQGHFSETDSARAAAFGMMAAEEDTGLLVIAAFGAGSQARASITPQAFFETASPEITAVFGAMVAATRANIPIIAEGPQAVAAAQALRFMRPELMSRVFLCGIQGNIDGIPVFADEDAQPALTGDAAITLAAVLSAAYKQTQEDA